MIWPLAKNLFNITATTRGVVLPDNWGEVITGDIKGDVVIVNGDRHALSLQESFATPIKQMIEENPSFGYRTVAHLLRFNKNTVQRIFQLKHWQVRKHPVGFRPRMRVIPSVATALNERWATDLCRIRSGRDGWAVCPRHRLL